MKKRILLAFSALLFCLFSLVAHADVKPTDSTLVDNLPKNSELLFVLLSKQGAIHAVPDAKEPGSYELTLTDVNPNVLYFANRPTRLSGQVDTTKFIGQWKQGFFAKEAPNAVMEAVRLNANNQPERSVSYAIILENPVYNKDNDTVTFEIHALPGNKLPLPQMAHSDYVAIFIDSVCLSCIVN